MKRSIILSGSLLATLASATAAIPAHAVSSTTTSRMEITGTDDDAEAIRAAIEERENEDSYSQMWSRAQQKKLSESLSEALNPASQPAFVSAQERAQKCFPWMWEGGQRDRLALSIAAQLCLKSNLDKDLQLSQMGSSIESLADSQLYIFNTQFELMRARGEGQMPMQGTPSASGNVSVLGKQVWADTARAPQIRWEKSFQLLNFDQSQQLPFAIGPVPASATVGARGTAGAKFVAILNVGNGNVSAIPTADIDGYAFGGVDIKVVKGGVDAQIGIVQDTIEIKGGIGLVIDPTTLPPRLVYSASASGYNTFAGLNGDVAIVAKTTFQIPGFGNSFRYPLFTYPGFKAQGFMFSERIEPTPVKF